MGHRANLILVQNHQHTLHYCHWCGTTIPEDFFWGPEFAVPFIQKQRVEEQFWQDQIFAEGGVVMDTDHKMLLLWGGDHLLWDVPLRRVFLELMQQVWAGWTIHWAYNGVFDMVDYLELPHYLVTNRLGDYLFERPPLFAHPNEESWGFSVASIRFADGELRLFPLDGEIGWRLEKGPNMLKAARRRNGLPTITTQEWTDAFPRGGFHIDVAQKQLAFWAAHAPGVAMQVIPQWPGWQVEWWRDEFEFHLGQTGLAWSVPVPPAEQSLAWIEEKLMNVPRWDMPALLMGLAGGEEMSGVDVQINPDALTQDTQDIPAETRRRILTKAIEAWQAQRTMMP